MLERGRTTSDVGRNESGLGGVLPALARGERALLRRADLPTGLSVIAIAVLGNVLMTPHVSGWTEGMLEARAEVIAENIRRVARGEPPLHLVATGA